jgi:hypothetical protein
LSDDEEAEEEDGSGESTEMEDEVDAVDPLLIRVTVIFKLISFGAEAPFGLFKLLVSRATFVLM